VQATALVSGDCLTKNNNKIKKPYSLALQANPISVINNSVTVE